MKFKIVESMENNINIINYDDRYYGEVEVTGKKVHVNINDINELRELNTEPINITWIHKNEDDSDFSYYFEDGKLIIDIYPCGKYMLITYPTSGKMYYYKLVGDGDFLYEYVGTFPEKIGDIRYEEEYRKEPEYYREKLLSILKRKDISSDLKDEILRFSFEDY